MQCGTPHPSQRTSTLDNDHTTDDTLIATDTHLSDSALFSVSSTAELIAVKDYANTSLAAINELLDAGVLHGEMSGTGAWLVQHLIATREATTDHILRALTK